jgi:hypothetical protein
MPRPAGNQGSHVVEVDSKGTDMAAVLSAEDQYRCSLARMYTNTAVGPGAGMSAEPAGTVEEW